MRHATCAVTDNAMEVSQEVCELHCNVAMDINFVFLNGLIVHVTASREVNLCAIKRVSSESVNSALVCFKTVIETQNERHGHRVTMNLTL